MNNTTTLKNRKHLSMSEKIRRMVVRAELSEDAREEYSTADICRWLGTDLKHLKKLVATLNTREQLGVRFEKKSLRFAF